MRIFPINFMNVNNQSHVKRNMALVYHPQTSGETVEDLFVKSENINFRSGTSAGGPLRQLRKIKCPYFGVEMLNGKELFRAEEKLDKCKNIKEVVSVLYKYRKYMQAVEKKMYKRFAEYAKNNPNKKLNECLSLWYDEALMKLKLEEFNVLDDVDKLSMQMRPRTALAVHTKTTWCRQAILENNRENTFKRKHLLDSLEEIHARKGEKHILEKLKDRAAYLPTSGTSENAFIVKYAERSQEEIAKRILRPSRATIEHIKPNSEEGENEIGNFLLASAGANNLRSNMPLYKFIDMFPKIPKFCQRHIDQVIELMNKGWLKKNETYPYKVRNALARESKGRILLDLSNYKYKVKDAARLEKVDYFKKYKK